MKLYIKHTATSLGMVMMVMAGVSQAGNIQFNGQVTDQTCKSSIFGATNPTIYLDAVAVSAFGGSPSVGATAGLTEFTISISDCAAPTAGDETITVGFQADGLVEDGNIVNTTLAANGGSNANLRLFNDAAGTDPIALNGNLLTPATPIILANGQTATSRKYYVGYVAAQVPVTTGAVTGAVNYVVRYD